MTAENNPKLKLDGEEIYFIELEKFRKIKPEMTKKLDQWLAFLDNTREEFEKSRQSPNERGCSFGDCPFSGSTKIK